MIGLLILAQRDIGKGLILAVEHVLGRRPEQLDAFPVNYDQPPETLMRALRPYVERLDSGDGVIMLADIYGATHINAACRLLQPNRVELIAGVNLPMLIRILNYRTLALPEVVDKALSGGREGIVCGTDICHIDAPK